MKLASFLEVRVENMLALVGGKDLRLRKQVSRWEGRTELVIPVQLETESWSNTHTSWAFEIISSMANSSGFELDHVGEDHEGDKGFDLDTRDSEGGEVLELGKLDARDAVEVISQQLFISAGLSFETTAEDAAEGSRAEKSLARAGADDAGIHVGDRIETALRQYVKER
ncbi:hypothetical protein V8G54_003344 [Vigna mungo]|uniref:Uncharacterized protein n=1 Tax=Vigna mungo TaxID=3915 RepID=A0AAQ3PD71_VIGMU